MLALICNKGLIGASVPGHDHAAIGYALDAGASIVIPQVDTVEEARHVVSAAKFGSQNRGSRSAPPFRLIPGISNIPIDESKTIHENLNLQAAIMIQIETLEGINNLDAILTEVSDIDAIWLGTLDLQVSMGLEATGMPREETEYKEAVEKFDSILRKHDKPRGGLALGPPEVKKAIGKDNSLSFVAADVAALSGMVGDLMETRAMFPAARKMAAKTKEVINGYSHGEVALKN